MDRVWLLKDMLRGFVLKVLRKRAKLPLTQTVLKNLLANALKYWNAENAPVEIRINTTDDKTHIDIQDHGQYIPKEAGLALDLIFEPFYRNDKSRNKKTGGSGLGLSLCKTIIEEHGGTICVKSKFWEGATFCLNLPNSP